MFAGRAPCCLGHLLLPDKLHSFQSDLTQPSLCSEIFLLWPRMHEYRRVMRLNAKHSVIMTNKVKLFLSASHFHHSTELRVTREIL